MYERRKKLEYAYTFKILVDQYQKVIIQIMKEPVAREPVY